MASLPPKKFELEQSFAKNTTAKVNEIEKSNTKGGFDCEFVSIPSKGVQWECSVCLQILREPYQAPCCGNSFCRICIERIKTNNKPCPTCNEENFATYHNKGLQRSLYEFPVYCSHKKEGCEWIGILGELDSHLNLSPTPDKQLEGCEYSEIECSYCSELKKRCDVAVHQADLCPKRPFSCKYCHSYESHYEDVVKHYSECSSHPEPLVQLSTSGHDVVDTSAINAGQEVLSNTDPPPDETNTSFSPESGEQQPPPETTNPPPPIANDPPDQRQQDPVPPEQNINQPPAEVEHRQDLNPPAEVNNPPPVDVGRRQDNPNQHGHNKTTFCFGLCIGFGLPVLLGVLIYFHIQADKCNLMQTLVRKCEHDCTTTPLWYECHCDSGHTLNSNKWQCDDINECIEKTHNCTHKCVNTRGSFTCACDDGYIQRIEPETDKIICEDINECDNGKHKCDQMCSNTIGSYQCGCRNGYRLDNDGFTCRDIDECTNSEKKLCPQICHNTLGSYECDCFVGYSLKEDQTNCRDVDECKSGKHKCVQNCHNTDGSYQCSCRTGYTLNKDGFDCDDVDECASEETNRCEQICNNTDGSYECLCRTGFIENDDGFRCDDVNECAKMLHRCTKEHSNCNNTVGSYTCYCDPGYRIKDDGVTCKDIDECDEMIDKCEHLCTNTEGSYTCRCYPRGHFYLNDDGFSCDGWLDRVKANPDMTKEHWFQEMWDSSSSLDILMTGKTGSGKSTLVNGLVGAKVVNTTENKLSRDTINVTSYTREVHGVNMRIWDSPGLQDRTGNEQEYIKQIKENCHSVDLVLYCIKMDETRLYDDDRDAILVLKNAFGRQFWNRTFFILTFANKVEPPMARKHDKEGYFKERLAEWTKMLHGLLTGLDIHIKMEHFERRVIPAGYETPHLPDRKYWLSALWHNVLEEADERAQGSMLKMGLQRMINETLAENYDFEGQDMDEQPIVSPHGVWWNLMAALQGWVLGE